MEYIFIDGADKGIYNGGINIISGSLKVGEVIDALDDGNHHYHFKINEIRDFDTDILVNILGAGKSGFVVMQTLDQKKVTEITGGFTFGPDLKVSSNPDIVSATSCKINGSEWKGSNFYNSASYFPNGNELISTKKPYFILAFKSASGPDNRQLTFQLKDFKKGSGIKDYKTIEVVISGNSEGLKRKRLPSFQLGKWAGQYKSYII
ncbi:MAG: hypothetical protein IPO92_04485 [Saprospiraceae bacterium]|nr:hypothetical protein [Saprospiraceae bacterium]